MAAQRIESPNDSERAVIARRLWEARFLAQKHIKAADDAVLDPVTLNAIFAAARAAESLNPNSLVNALGVAFGQFLVDTLGFEWAVVTDEQGCELAVHALPGTADMLVFPTHAVAKRSCRGEGNFFVYLYDGLREQLEQYRADWGITRQCSGPEPQV